MTPDVVVDIGNTRLKWGVCRDGRVTEVLRLPLDDAAAWDAALAKLPPPQSSARKWAVASVNPPALHRFGVWAYPHGGTVAFETHADLPIRVNVDEPGSVGLDRLMNALAAHRLAAPEPAVVLGVGTAVTVDLIDHSGAFLGGAIFPGPRLMAEALHTHTAKLPLVDAAALPAVQAPGKNTREAILAGIRYAIVGAAYLLVDRYAAEVGGLPCIFVTGGAAGDLGEINFGDDFTGTQAVPTLTLEGIRIAAEWLP